ncbi:MAG: hypothetical protein ACRDBG_26385, partial [Waterburya sp.]
MEKDKIQSFLTWARSHLDSKLRLSLSQGQHLLSIADGLMQLNEKLETELGSTNEDLRVALSTVDKLITDKYQLNTQNNEMRSQMLDLQMEILNYQRQITDLTLQNQRTNNDIMEPLSPILVPPIIEQMKQAFRQSVLEDELDKSWLKTPVTGSSDQNYFDLAKAEPGQKILIDLCEEDWSSGQSIKTIIRAVSAREKDIRIWPDLCGIYVFDKKGDSICFDSDVWISMNSATESSNDFVIEGTGFLFMGDEE